MKTIYTLGYVGYTQGYGEQFPYLAIDIHLVFFESKELAEQYKKLNNVSSIVLELKEGQVKIPDEDIDCYGICAKYASEYAHGKSTTLATRDMSSTEDCFVQKIPYKFDIGISMKENLSRMFSAEIANVIDNKIYKHFLELPKTGSD